MAERFRDRSDAGRRLASQLLEFVGRNPVVLALPPGGVPVAYEVAARLSAPLDLLHVRTLAVPGKEEVIMGAVVSGGVRMVDEEIMSEQGMTEDTVAMAAAEEQQALEREERRQRGGRPDPVVKGRTVILVADGLDSGSIVAAAAAAVRSRDPAELVVAVPVASSEACERLRPLVDAVVCATRPSPFGDIGRWYEDFAGVGDDEVQELMRRRNEEEAPPDEPPPEARV